MQQSHEPELLKHLREKSLQLQLTIDREKQRNRQSLQSFQHAQKQSKELFQQREVQERKYRSLIVLLNQLQRTYYDTYLENQIADMTSEQGAVILENSFLRSLLVKQTEHVKEIQKLMAFLKQLEVSGNSIRSKAKQYIFKQPQIYKEKQFPGKSSINSRQASNPPKKLSKQQFAILHTETQTTNSSNKLLNIHLERQKTLMKAHYENYLDRINDSKAKVVEFNQQQRQNIITEWFVQEMAILQEKRVEVEQQNNNLNQHLEMMSEQGERMEVQHRELMSFFRNNGEEGLLANKMKIRIDELRDTLLQLKKRNKNPRAAKLSKVVDHARAELNKCRESNDFLQLRIQEQEDKGLSLEDKPIAQFFTKILQNKDKELVILRQQENALKDKKKQLQLSKQLLANQISSLEENLQFGGFQHQYKQAERWKFPHLPSFSNQP